jgi:hypothetical protein
VVEAVSRLKSVASSPECAKARSETRDSTWTYGEVERGRDKAIGAHSSF